RRASVLSAIFLLITAARAGDSPSDIERIRSHGKLVVAMFEQDRPPFFMHDARGKFVGIDVELAEEIADKIGVKVDFDRSAKSFNDVITKVERREADLGISKLSITTERSLRVRFSEPYVTLQQAFLVNRIAQSSSTHGHDSLLFLNR